MQSADANNLDLCIEGCSLDGGKKEVLELDNDEREGFFDSILKGDLGRATGEVSSSIRARYFGVT